MNIPDMLKKYRLQRHLTQEQVANQLFLSKNAYSQYETGKRHVDAVTFFKILDIFNVKTDFSIPLHGVYNAKSLLIYKDIDDGVPRFQIEMYDYHPIEKKSLGLESTNYGAGPAQWLSQQEAFATLQYLKKDPRFQLEQIEFVDYETFDFTRWKEDFQEKSYYAFSTSMMKRVFQKGMEDRTGTVPQFDIYTYDDNDFMSFDFNKSDETTLNALRNSIGWVRFAELWETRKEKCDIGEEDPLDLFFEHYFNKRITKIVYDNENDIHLFFFKPTH